MHEHFFFFFFCKESYTRPRVWEGIRVAYNKCMFITWITTCISRETITAQTIFASDANFSRGQGICIVRLEATRGLKIIRLFVAKIMRVTNVSCIYREICNFCSVIDRFHKQTNTILKKDAHMILIQSHCLNGLKHSLIQSYYLNGLKHNFTLFTIR